MPYERLRIAYMSKLDFSIVRTVHGHTASLTLLLYVRYKYSTLSLTHVTFNVPVRRSQVQKLTATSTRLAGKE